MIIYCVTNKINNKKYIGQTISSLKKRWAEHCSTRPDVKLLHQAIKKYGKENFEIESLKECNSIEDLNFSEIQLIKEYNTLTPNDYNLALGGNQQGKHSEETKNKIRLAHLGKSKGPMSEDHKVKIKIANTGKTHSDKTKEKLKIISERNKIKYGSPIIDQNNQVYISIREAARQLNLHPISIRKVLNKTQPKTKGYTFNYYQEK